MGNRVHLQLTQKTLPNLSLVLHITNQSAVLSYLDSDMIKQKWCPVFHVLFMGWLVSRHARRFRIDQFSETMKLYKEDTLSTIEIKHLCRSLDNAKSCRCRSSHVFIQKLECPALREKNTMFVGPALSRSIIKNFILKRYLNYYAKMNYHFHTPKLAISSPPENMRPDVRWLKKLETMQIKQALLLNNSRSLRTQLTI